MKEIKRDFYLNQLIKKDGNGQIKIITGIRRCGKSYLLKKIFDGIKNDNLYKIVSSSKDINYFYFQELIADLMSANLICSFEQDEESFIKITTEGKKALELTKSLLPGLLKLKADTIFKEENSNIVEESSVVTEFIPKDENNYTITCKIVEQNETIFEVSVYAASREKAKQISDNWKSNATTLYPQILELLSNNKDGANINE